MNISTFNSLPVGELKLLFALSAITSERPLLISGIIALGVLVIVLCIWIYRIKVQPIAVPSTEELRGRLAQVVTMWAMVAIVVLSVTILSIAGYRSAATGTVEASREFVDTAKFIFAAVVPVVAGWVGTVMAFYFGKENFRAATESVSQIAKQFTSQDKLGQTRAEEIGKAIDDAAPLRFGPEDKFETVTLDRLQKTMQAKAPPFERLPILSATGTPLMVVHRSVLNDFLLTKKETDSAKSAKDYNLSDLIKDYPWLLKTSFVTIPRGATAADGKQALERVKGCADLFVTADGTTHAAVIRWITNVDLLQAAQV